MSKPELKPVPEPDPIDPELPATLRLELTGEYAGHWVEYRLTPTVDEFIAGYSGDMGRIFQAAKDRIIKHSFKEHGGDIGKQPVPVIIAIIKAWTQRDEEAALDPTPAVD